MLLRKLVAALCPLLLCLLSCVCFRWLDAALGASSFLSFLLKGMLLGLCLSLTLPLAGVRSRTNGLSGWLLVGAGLLALLLLYQYLEISGILHWPLALNLISVNGQVVLAEGALLAFLTVTGLINRGR